MAEVLELAAKNNVTIHGLSVRGVIQAPEEEDVAGPVLVADARRILECFDLSVRQERLWPEH